MFDDAFVGDGAYGYGYSPMSVQDAMSGENVRYDPFDAAVGGGNGTAPNIPGLNCSATAETGALYRNESYNNPGGRSSSASSSSAYNGQNSGHSSASSSMYTENGSSVVWRNGGYSVPGNANVRREVSINDLLSAEMKIKLFAAFSNDPVVKAKVDKFIYGAAKSYKNGDLARNDFKKSMKVAAYIYSHKNNDNGK